VSRSRATREIDASLNPEKGERAFLFMAKILPPARPKKPENDVRAIVKHFNLDPRRLAIVFIRGYFLESMGASGVNDANVYDDAAFLVGPSMFESYNANTDPSFVKVNGRELAKLNLGRYLFYKGKHKNYARLHAERKARDCSIYQHPQGLDKPKREGCRLVRGMLDDSRHPMARLSSAGLFGDVENEAEGH
jgi:hypothetical protein